MHRATFTRLLPINAMALALTFALAACGGASDPAETAAEDAAADPNAAPAAFAQCSMCHSVEPGQNGLGPSLAGVFGQSAGHVGDFGYSPAMRESGLVWDEATLDEYLKNPRATVPGTSMSYAGLSDDAARAELVEWLKGV